MVGVVITLIMLAVVSGGLIAMFWEEVTDWYHEQIEKSPHQIVRKWKTKYFSSIQYHWKCECGKEDWSNGKVMSYNSFVSHRNNARKMAKVDKKVSEAETEGW